MAITYTLSHAAQVAEASAGRPAHVARSIDVTPGIVARVLALGGVIGDDGVVRLKATSIKEEHGGPTYTEFCSGWSSYTRVYIDSVPECAVVLVEKLEQLIAPARAAYAAKLAKEQAEKEAVEQQKLREIDQTRALLSTMTDEQLANRVEAGKGWGDDGRFQAMHVNEALGRDRVVRVLSIVSARAKAHREADVRADEARLEQQRARTLALVTEHRPDLLSRLTAGVLPDAELKEALSAVLLAPLADFARYTPITKADVRAAEARENAENDDFEATEPVKFRVVDVLDGAYTCTAEQWDTITRIREIAAKGGLTATVRKHTGTTDDMAGFFVRLSVRVCSEYAPGECVCADYAV